MIDQALHISLCVIARNEDRFIRELLLHAKPHCDQLIVVDTGSTDQTVAMAREVGALVFDFAWTDDFSAARNFALSQASGDWVLMLDADERVTDADWVVLTQQVRNTPEDCFDLCQVNYVNQANVVGFCENDLGVPGFSQYRGYTVSWLSRLFRNNGRFCFKGVVHEHLYDDRGLADGKRLKVSLHHHGQALSAELMLAKKREYARLGEQKIARNPDDAKAWHEWGIALWELGNLKGSLKALLQADQLQPDQSETLIALGTVHQLQRDFASAGLCFERVRDRFPTHPSVHVCLGRLYFETGLLKDAIQAYKKQIRIDPGLEIARLWLAEAFALWREKGPDYRPTLSVCYIMRNEKDCLEQALSNVKGHADEIIMADTGSNDGSQDIARRMGAFVCQIPWKDDFAWARNQSLKHATSEWVLVLDVDEVLSAEDWSGLARLMAAPTALEYYLVQTTYCNKSTILRWKANDLKVPEAKGYEGYFESPLVRLFKNTPAIQFRGAVHEHAHHADPRVQPMLTGVRIHHYGKYRNEKRMQEKSDLYLKIGQKKLKDMPDEPHVYYEMAVQLWEMRTMDQVEFYLRKALALDPMHRDAAIALACLLHEQKHFADAIDQFVHVIKQFPQHADAYLFLSSLLIEIKKYDMAIAMMAEAKAHGFDNDVAMLMNEGVIFLNTCQYDKAQECYLKALAVNPRFEPVLLNLGIVCLKKKDFVQACRYLDLALAENPDSVVAQKLRGEALFGMQDFSGALRCFQEAQRIDPCDEESLVQLIIVWHRLGNQQECLCHEQKLSLLPASESLSGLLSKLRDLYARCGDREGVTRIENMSAVKGLRVGVLP